MLKLLLPASAVGPGPILSLHQRGELNSKFAYFCLK